MRRDPEHWRDGGVDAAAAVSGIPGGARVFVGSACATPRVLVGALERLEERPSGVELVHFLTDGAPPEEGARPWTVFRHRTWYIGRDMRDLWGSRKIDYVPLSIADVPALIAAGRIRIDVALVQVGPPDADGQCSLGISVDVTRAAALAAEVVIAEINPNMPDTGAESRIPFDRISAYTVVDAPLIEYRHPPVDAAAEQIARYVARIIDDGAVLQVGLGRVPNEMLRYLTERRDLAMHSDIVTDPIVDLCERGVITGPIVASTAMGTERLYRVLAEGDRCSLVPIDRLCDVTTLASVERLASVTHAFTIDLSGQVCAEARDGEPYGGVATQPDFHRAAARSRDGKAIVCLSSLRADGSSAIRVRLNLDEPVTLGRADVHWVVTEFGTAYLHGRSLRERAAALIEVAHPDHRADLLAGAIEVGVLPATQKLRSRVAYPVGEDRTVRLRDDRSVVIRPSRTTDASLVQDLFFRLGEDDVQTRFFRRLRSLTDEMAQHLCSVGYADEMAFAAVIGDQESERIVGTSSYFVDASTGMADVAYMVDPAWQGIGLASELQAQTIDYARRHGVRGFRADVLAHNAAMLAVFRRSGLRMTTSVSSGTYEVGLYFE